MSEQTITLDAFLEDWPDGFARQAFMQFRAAIDAMDGVHCELNARPGVSYSLRPRAEGQERPLFALVDVIDDPSGRWLSVCFYADYVTDPDEVGDFVPEGLLGENAVCFDVDEDEPGSVALVLEKLAEARSKAS
ncbi:hypothetical protein [Salidesulfovibrio brasiliensis]|uniref:hypothetical protein n=1 Tax=Salidesulfovibrio brasiliensis TaxID=221711 RepID=UPI0006D18FFC|nr:hypothetical protein [Salidesulfovibrio brasiliensis]